MREEKRKRTEETAKSNGNRNERKRKEVEQNPEIQSIEFEFKTYSERAPRALIRIDYYKCIFCARFTSFTSDCMCRLNCLM